MGWEEVWAEADTPEKKERLKEEIAFRRALAAQKKLTSSRAYLEKVTRRCACGTVIYGRRRKCPVC